MLQEFRKKFQYLFELKNAEEICAASRALFFTNAILVVKDLP
mgnify:CR=1 FL=1